MKNIYMIKNNEKNGLLDIVPKNTEYYYIHRVLVHGGVINRDTS